MSEPMATGSEPLWALAREFSCSKLEPLNAHTVSPFTT